MVLETLGVLSGMKGLFMYNRQNFKFNKTLDQERLYHLQKMRVEQVKLYRDDIRDLFDLVVGKMNNYYLINTLALGFSLGFYYEGKVPDDIPSWLFWLWAMSLSSAIVFLFLSVWFAVHASVIAQMFLARLLTQWLRLPIPGRTQIDTGAPKLEEFEKVGAKESLRVPGTSKQSEVDPDPATTADTLLQEGYEFYMGHFYMFARLQKHWMNLDAYCRVCMVLGCNQILNAVTYTGLAYFALEDSQWGTISFVIIPVVFACIHVQLNLLLSRTESIVFLFFHSAAPLLGSIAAFVQMVAINDGISSENADVAQWIAIGSYVCHFVSSAFLLVWGTETRDGLPVRFTTVNYIDVLGLLAKSAKKFVGAEGVAKIFHSSSVVEKEEPSAASVVPLAEGMRHADTLYQELVGQKVAAESRKKSALISSEDVSADVFATQAPAPRGSVKLMNTVIERKLQKQKSHGRFGGPLDYAPTVAQLQAPDILARMPHVAYKVIGITILALWLLSIIMGILDATSLADSIRWSNNTIHS